MRGLQNIKKTILFLLFFLVGFCTAFSQAETKQIGSIILFQNANVRIIEEQMTYRNETVNIIYTLKNSGANSEHIYLILPLDSSWEDRSEELAAAYRLSSTIDNQPLRWNVKEKREVLGIDSTDFAYVSKTINFEPTKEYKLTVSYYFNPLIDVDPEFGNEMFKIKYTAGRGLKAGQSVQKTYYSFYLPLEGLRPGHSADYGPFPVFTSGSRQWGPYTGFLDLKANPRYSGVVYNLNEVLVKYEKTNLKEPFTIELLWCNKSWEGKEVPYFDDFSDPTLYNLLSGYPYYSRLEMFQNKTWFSRLLIYLSEYISSGKTDWDAEGRNNAFIFIKNTIDAMSGKKFPAGPTAEFYSTLRWYKAAANGKQKLDPGLKKILTTAENH